MFHFLFQVLELLLEENGYCLKTFCIRVKSWKSYNCKNEYCNKYIYSEFNLYFGEEILNPKYAIIKMKYQSYLGIGLKINNK